jgi:hypothetical protein
MQSRDGAVKEMQALNEQLNKLHEEVRGLKKQNVSVVCLSYLVRC